MSQIKLYSETREFDSLISIINRPNNRINYDNIFSYSYYCHDSAHILDKNYDNYNTNNTNNDETPYNIWSLRNVGSSSGEDIEDVNVRNSYKITSHKDKYSDKYTTLTKRNDEFYVYISDIYNIYNKNYGTNYYGNVEFTNISNWSNELQTNIRLLNTYLVNSYGKNYKDEATYDFIHYDYSNDYFDKNSTNLRKWKVHKYETGGFFKGHKDSKLNEYHIGTLILIPPKDYSQYTGGNLVVYDENDDTKILLNVSPSDGWQCVFIKLCQKHEILEVTTGVRYSFTSPYCICKATIDNINNQSYYQEINQHIIDNIKVKTILDNLHYELSNIEREIELLNKKKQTILNKIENKDFTYTQEHNEVLNIDILNNKSFIIICENFYENPTPETLLINDALTFNSVFERFKCKTPEISFFNTHLSINAGYSDESCEYSEENKENFWGYESERTAFYDDNNEVNSKVSFERYMLNCETFEYIFNKKDGCCDYPQYCNYICYYNSNFPPGKYTYLQSEYNDEVYENTKYYNITCMIVNFE